MNCQCVSCVRLGKARPPHIGDCEACNADGDTTEVTYGRSTYDLCAHCAADVEETMAGICERRASHEADGGRCFEEYEP